MNRPFEWAHFVIDIVKVQTTDRPGQLGSKSGRVVCQEFFASASTLPPRLSFAAIAARSLVVSVDMSDSIST